MEAGKDEPCCTRASLAAPLGARHEQAEHSASLRLRRVHDSGHAMLIPQQGRGVLEL